MNNKDNRITGRSILLGAIFAAAFACLTMFLENRRTMQPTANQIPLFPYILLLVMVLLVNPLLRLLRVFRRLSAVEMLIIFIMTMVSSGMSTYGLAQQFLPLAGSLFNRHWNTEQTEWKRYVEPFLNENYFVSEPGIRQAAWEYRDALLRLQEMRGQDPGADLSEQERLVELIGEGVTTIEIKSGYGLDAATEARQLRAARLLGELRPVSVATT